MDISYEIVTPKNFEIAVKDLKENLSSLGFGVLWEINFKEKLLEKGLDFNTNFKILEVCNPAQAKKVLEKQIDMGYFLPCKMVVFEKEGYVHLGMLRPTILAEIVGGLEILTTASEVETVLKSAIDKTV